MVCKATIGRSSEILLLFFQELSFGNFSLSDALFFVEGDSSIFQNFENVELLRSGSFKPCFDFFFCSETTFAKACDVVDGADGHARRNDAGFSSDWGLLCGELGG